MTDYNPVQAKQGVLYPCHSIIIQFYVFENYLDLFCYNRSSDIGLGLPFNIASTSLLLILIAKLTNKIPRYMNLTLGDAHIYENHVNVLREQIRRVPFAFPKLIIEKHIETLFDVSKMTFEDFVLKDYNSYERLKMDMIA